MSRKKVSFEEALKRLEAIAEQIDQGKIGLEESIARYEEGIALIRQCRDILTQAELRIQKLQVDAEGQPSTAPFDVSDSSQPFQVTPEDLENNEDSETIPY